MIEPTAYNQYLNYAKDELIWKPLVGEEVTIFNELISKVETSLFTGTNKEKGDSLENLMTFIYERFSFIDVVSNARTTDNQIDHIVKFIDGMVPTFVHQNIGLVMIGESKNHKDSISVREVADLSELLRSKRARFGIFSSYKSFSKGKSLWTLAEGKRRKLALATDTIIIGFNLNELRTLTSNNFYTMLKQKFNNIIDEISDDFTDDEFELTYQDRLKNSIQQLYTLDLINEVEYAEISRKITERLGSIISPPTTK